AAAREVADLGAAAPGRGAPFPARVVVEVTARALAVLPDALGRTALALVLAAAGELGRHVGVARDQHGARRRGPDAPPAPAGKARPAARGRGQRHLGARVERGHAVVAA